MDKNHTQQIFMSLIICTWNRANEIVSNFIPVAEQAKNFPDVEVIIVDNGSTDNTKDVVRKLSDSLGYPFRYFNESQPGSSYARNRGRAEARGVILAYIDDDAVIMDKWIEKVRQHFVERKSDCLGGKVFFELGGEIPFKKTDYEVAWFFMQSNLGEKARYLVYPEYPIGCNMAFRKEVFDEVGGFDTKLKLYGDETDLFRRICNKGFKVFYDPTIIVSQFVPAERLTKEELKIKSVKWGKGSAMRWLIENPNSLRFFKIVEYVARTVYMGIMAKVRGNFGGFFTYWYNRGYLSQLKRGLE